jgi:hypothetical protein
MQTVVAHRFVGPLDNKTYAVHERYFVPDVIPSRETRVTGNVADPYQHVRVKCAACRTSYLADVAAMRAIHQAIRQALMVHVAVGRVRQARRRLRTLPLDEPSGYEPSRLTNPPATNPPA